MIPKISILIPVYNVECYLRDCLDSIVKQSEPNIEIICVEDASTDNSLEILQEYAASDSRIRTLRHDRNKGLCQTRKDAVKLAQGEFIMFVDSDDYLSLDACEKLYQEIVRRNVDFLQFGTKIKPSKIVSEKMVEWVDNFMIPSVERIEGEALLKACFVEGKFNCNLVNKIWTTECCKKAYEQILDGYYVSAEDRYTTFILAYYAKSYEGTQEKFYHYRLGTGVTGGEVLDLKRFEQRCKGTQVVENVKTFLQGEGTFDKYKDVFEAFANDILWDCVDCWYNKLEKEDSAKGYNILLNHWDADKIVGVIGRRYFENQKDICQKIDYASLSIRKKVGIYYRYFGYEPMMEFIEWQLKETNNLGYDVIIFTDEDAPITTENMLPKFKNVVLLPASKEANWEDYNKRAEVFLQQMRYWEINYFFYASPTSHIAWLDALLIRSEGIDISFMDEKNITRLNELTQEKKELVKKHEQMCQEKKELVKTYEQMCQEKKELVEKHEQVCQEKKQILESKAYRTGEMIKNLTNFKYLFTKK